MMSLLPQTKFEYVKVRIREVETTEDALYVSFIDLPAKRFPGLISCCQRHLVGGTWSGLVEPQC